MEVSATDALPLHSLTPSDWGKQALSDPAALLTDHAYLEKKAAINAMELMVRWPDNWTPGWVEALTAIALKRLIRSSLLRLRSELLLAGPEASEKRD